MGRLVGRLVGRVVGHDAFTGRRGERTTFPPSLQFVEKEMCIFHRLQAAFGLVGYPEGRLVGCQVQLRAIHKTVQIRA